MRLAIPGSMSASQGPSTLVVALCGLVTLAVAMGIGRFAFSPVIPLMQAAGLTIGEAGWLASANYAGYLAGAMVAARHQSARRSLKAGLATIVVTTWAMGIAESFAPWVVLRALAGAASAIVFVHASAWCLEHFHRHGSPRSAGVVYAGVGCGICAAGLLCMGMMALGADADHVWFALALLGALGSVSPWVVMQPGQRPDAPPEDARFPWTPDARRLVACYAALGIGYIIPATFLPVMAKQAIADPRLFGWVWPIFGAAAAVSTVLAASRPWRWTRRRMWMAANLVMAAGLLLPALSPSLAAASAAGLLIGGTFMVITMVAMQEARSLAGDKARTLIAAMTAAFAAGQIAGPLIASLLARGSGSFSSALMLAAILLGLSAAGLVREPHPPDQARSPR